MDFNPSASTSCLAGIKGVLYHAQPHFDILSIQVSNMYMHIAFISRTFFFEVVSLYVAQSGQELLGSSDPSTSACQVLEL